MREPSRRGRGAAARLAAASLLLLQAALESAVSSAQTTALIGGTVIDGNGGVIKDGVVVIEGSRIAAVGGPDTAVPANASRMPVHGKYIIPGLMDANVHLLIDVRLETLVHYEGRYPDLIVEAAQVALKNGLTTVFDSWGPLEALQEARRRINEGEAGSRVFLAGNIVGFGSPISQDFKPAAAKVASRRLQERINGEWEQNVGRELLWMPVDQLRTEIRAYANRGIDFLKYGASGHTLTEMQFITFSGVAQQAIVEEARRAGITVQTHTSSIASFMMAVEAGVDLMQHCETTGPIPLPDAAIQALVDKKIPCAVLAQTEHGLSRYRRMASDPELGLFYGVFQPVKDQNIRKLLKAGANLLLSTDAGVVYPDLPPASTAPPAADDKKDVLTELGGGHYVWLEAMEEKGMAPMAMLIAATRNIARAYKVDRDLGTLQTGKLADLLVLDRNPLQRAEHYRSISLIMKEGRIVPRDGLPRRRFLTRP